MRDYHKLRRFAIALPVREGRIDEDAISIAMRASPYWKHVRTRLGFKQVGLGVRANISSIVDD